MEEQQTKKKNQKMIGVTQEIKEQLETQMKEKGYKSRPKYIKYLLEKENDSRITQ